MARVAARPLVSLVLLFIPCPPSYKGVFSLFYLYRNVKDFLPFLRAITHFTRYL